MRIAKNLINNFEENKEVLNHLIKTATIGTRFIFEYYDSEDEIAYITAMKCDDDLWGWASDRGEEPDGMLPQINTDKEMLEELRKSKWSYTEVEYILGDC